MQRHLCSAAPGHAGSLSRLLNAMLEPSFTLEARGDALHAITAEGNAHLIVKAQRLFPLTEPQQWVSLRDAAGVEIACIEHLETLSPPQRALLEALLLQREFVPIIQRIHSVNRAADGHLWHVSTDRGEARFRIENDESIQTLSPVRRVIMDDRNLRYLVPDITQLDADSRKRLERYY
jgi:hypothetical protein